MSSLLTRRGLIATAVFAFCAATAVADVDIQLAGGRLSWRSGETTLGGSDQWLQVRDLAASDVFVPFPVTGDETAFTGAGDGLRFEGGWTPRGFARELTLTVTANPLVDRALIVRVALPLDAVGWTWWDDTGTARTIEAGKHYDRLTRWGGLREVSAYPFCGVGNGRVGVSAAVPVHEPQVFRLGYDATRQALEAEFDIGLAPETVKFPCRSTIRLLVYPHDPAWGFRSAMERYYGLFPEYAERRVGPGGIWLIGLAPNAMACPWDWGFRFEEHGLEHAGYNDAHDILTFVYTECWGIYEGYGNNPPPDGKDRYGRNVYPGTAEQMRQSVLDRLDAPADQKRWGLPQSEIARAEVNSAIEDINGQWIWSHYTQTWSPGNFLCNICLNPDPDLPPPSRNSVTWDGEITPAYQQAQRAGGTLGGVYLDSVCGYVGFHDESFRREHWQYADTPLVASYRARQPVQLHGFSCHEISKQIADRMREEGRYVIGNTGPPEMTYWIPLLDMLGAGEANQCGMSDERHYRYLRFCAYHKPISWMQYGFVDPTRSWEEKERGMHRSLFYAVHPGTARFNEPARYEPSRPLYRYYEPLIIWLDAAGWQPVTLAQSSDPEVLVERYGPEAGPLGDVTFLALRNSGKDAREPRVSVHADALPASGTRDAIAWALVSDRDTRLTRTRDGCTISGITLAPDTTEVLAVGQREAVARLFLDQASEWLDRLTRETAWQAGGDASQIVANGDFEGGLASWGVAQGAFQKDAIAEADEAQPLAGERSALVQSGSEASLHGLNQGVVLTSGDEYTLRFTYSWTRPEGAKGTMVPRFGVKGPDGEWVADKYIYFRDVQPTSGEQATFERSFTVPDGCTTGFFQFMFSGHWGTVRLDDVRISSATLDAQRERLARLPEQASAAETEFRAGLASVGPDGLLAFTSRQEPVYEALLDSVQSLPEGHIKRCFLLPTRNFAEAIGRATEVLTGVSVGTAGGPPFVQVALGEQVEVACSVRSSGDVLAEVRIAPEGAAAVEGGSAAVGAEEATVPVAVPVPEEAPWGWHDAMLVTRFKVGTQSVWLPRRVTLRPRPALDVTAVGPIGAIDSALSLLVRSLALRPAALTLEATGRIGDTEFALPEQAVSPVPDKPAMVSWPLPADVAEQVDALAAAGRACEIRWKATSAAGLAVEGDLGAELLRGGRCPKVTSPVVVDGQLGADEWAEAAKLSGFVKHDDATPAIHMTDAYVARDASMLYVAFACHGQPEPKGVERPRDGAVWEDDCVEVFLQPPGSDTYYHLAVNAAGSCFEARCPGSDASWNPDMQAKAGRIDGGWVVEMAIPWAAVQGKPGGVWRINLGREDTQTKQATCWSPTFGGFHVPARFGEMVF